VKFFWVLAQGSVVLLNEIPSYLILGELGILFIRAAGRSSSSWVGLVLELILLTEAAIGCHCAVEVVGVWKTICLPHNLIKRTGKIYKEDTTLGCWIVEEVVDGISSPVADTVRGLRPGSFFRLVNVVNVLEEVEASNDDQNTNIREEKSVRGEWKFYKRLNG